MGGKGRKPANRGGGKRSQPAAKRTSGSGRSQPSGATATRAVEPQPREAPAAAGARSGQRTSTVSRPQNRPASRPQSRPQAYPFRDSFARRKRRQKLIVWIGVGALLAAGVVTVFVGQLGGRSNPGTVAAASSSATTPSTSAAATTAAAVASTTVAAAATGPVLVMSCPDGGGASPLFTHQIARATAPYSITISYGDGDKYTDTDQHLGAIFSHTYKAKGTYTVDAVLTDAAKQTASASCTYTW